MHSSAATNHRYPAEVHWSLLTLIRTCCQANVYISRQVCMYNIIHVHLYTQFLISTILCVVEGEVCAQSVTQVSTNPDHIYTYIYWCAIAYTCSSSPMWPPYQQYDTTPVTSTMKIYLTSMAAFSTLVHTAQQYNDHCQQHNEPRTPCWYTDDGNLWERN